MTGERLGQAPVHLYAVVHRGSPTKLHALLAARAEGFLPFHRAPLTVTRLDEVTSARLASSGEVIAVTRTSDDIVALAWGVDMLLRAQCATRVLQPNGLANNLAGLQPDEVPAYPVLRKEGTSYVGDWLDIVLPTPLAFLSAINISQGSGPWYRFNEYDPVNVVTRAATRTVLVVMAVGNERRSDDYRETLSAWAEASWVISVGATLSPGGGPLSPTSAVGIPGRSGPTLVAYGQSPRTDDPYWKGTSFAAGRVSDLIYILAGYTLTLWTWPASVDISRSRSVLFS